MLITLFVLVRIISNPLSNLFQKKLVSQNENPLFIIFVVFAFLSVVSIPLFPKLFLSGLPAEYFFYMLICAVFAVSGNALIVKALGYSDLSLLGPINSYKPVVGMIFGIYLLNEIPGWLGLIGVILILFGSYFIIDNNLSSNERNVVRNFINDKGIQFRITALVLSAIEAVFLKKTLSYSTPLLTMVMWCFAGFVVSGISLPFFMNNKNGLKLTTVWKKKNLYFLLFTTTAAMQFTTLLIFESMQVSYALALFQTSALVSVFLGYKYFNEKNIMKRIIGSLFMIAGSVLIIIYGK
jgi:drug/metabolite transporter (DMT)-like permease